MTILETIATVKERPNLLVEVKFKKFGQVECIVMHLLNTLVFYAKHRNKKSEDKTLRLLINEELP